MSLLAVTSGDIASGGVVEPEGVDFDGVNDYLSRSTDLVGNVDSKTFTFSAWVYVGISGASSLRLYNTFTSGRTNYGISISVNSRGYILVTASSTADSIVLQATVADTGIFNTQYTFFHLMFSVDLSNTSNRIMYINDALKTVNWTTYTNAAIDFTVTTHTLACDSASVSNLLKGRLSNLFLDYTYRDLSIEANRRLFITAEGKPTSTATLKALNPILYLPMKDAATAHINEGTGGNFTLNGTIATSNRGANQDNCKASYFDGTADYLSRTSLTGVADGKVFTFSCNFNVKSDSSNMYLFTIYNTVSYSGLEINVKPTANAILLRLKDSSSNNIFVSDVVDNSLFTRLNTNININIVIDMSLQSLCKFFINGTDKTSLVTISTFTQDALIDFTINQYRIGASAATYFNGNIGELYFDTKYIDLATSNPFWDSVAKRPKPVRQVIAETGITPLIAMPLDASNPGKNYGTGGDFTANSAPYVGARSASEFWARSAKFDGSTGYLSRTSPFSTNGKKITVVMAIRTDVAIAERIFTGSSPSSLNVINIGKANTNELYVRFQNGTTNVYSVTQTATTDGVFNTIMVSFDLSDINKRHFIVNRNEVNPTYATYTNLDISFGDLTSIAIGAITDGTQKWNGFGSLMYVLQDYIDFSQEVNRNKFVDQLGYPKDLKAQIDAGVIPKPLIYLPFDDHTNLGKNLGTGGNFSVVGTVTSGADFSL